MAISNAVISLSLSAAIATLLSIGCGIERESDRQLVDAAATGEAARVVALLSSGANIEAHARDDWTALTIAAREGRNDVVRDLLEKGAYVNAKEGGGHTALFWALKYERVDVANQLKRAGGRSE